MDSKELFALFHPFAAPKIESYRASGNRFVHYASAETGLEILKSQKIWFRNANLMNDFSEVVHGQTCMESAWNDEYLGGRLRHLLNNISEGFSDRFQRDFNARHLNRHAQSYIMCISEHGDKTVDEDSYGRLSMWRAYGGEKNVALVLNPDAILTEDENLIGAFGTPVLYADQKLFYKCFDDLVTGLERNQQRLANCDPDDIYQRLFFSFHIAVLSTKHPGFSEEREWRIIFSPTIYESEILKKCVKVVGGMPQILYELSLVDERLSQNKYAKIEKLLNKIIVGPTESPHLIEEAYAEVMLEIGIENPHEKLSISNIPLRR